MWFPIHNNHCYSAVIVLATGISPKDQEEPRAHEHGLPPSKVQEELQQLGLSSVRKSFLKFNTWEM